MSRDDATEEENCTDRVCSDFSSWFKRNKNGSKLNENISALEHNESCPLDVNELGRNSWSLLHTMAAYYPEKPSSSDCRQMKQFFDAFSRFYPCNFCAEDLRNDLKKFPVKCDSRLEFNTWLCDMHNRVNEKLGKPNFNCANLNSRWKEGPSDGSCG